MVQVEFKTGQRVQLMSRTVGTIEAISAEALTVRLRNGHAREYPPAMVDWVEVEAQDLEVGAVIENPANEAGERVTKFERRTHGVEFEATGMGSRWAPKDRKYWRLAR